MANKLDPGEVEKRRFRRYRARTRESGGSGNQRRQADTAIWRAA
jgi:hypothetical protein